VSTPAPNMYATTTTDFIKDKKKLAYTFGLAREAFQKVFLSHHLPFDPTVPGPGSYKHSEKTGKEGYRYTMRRRASKDRR
jgi:hypothetical protein